jgi:exodeoxyribonuclease VIII
MNYQFTEEQKHAARNDPIMLDLETLGTSSNSVIIAVGAVKFDPTTKLITDYFYEVVDRESCVEYGMEIDQSTVDWWAKQSTEARSAFNIPGNHIANTLMRFEHFANKHSTMWGNGSDFDNVLLSNAYRKVGIKQPWEYYNNRCYRTMKNMYPAIKLARTGTHHNAVDDAASQAYHLMNILEKLRG